MPQYLSPYPDYGNVSKYLFQGYQGLGQGLASGIESGVQNYITNRQNTLSAELLNRLAQYFMAGGQTSGGQNYAGMPSSAGLGVNQNMTPIGSPDPNMQPSSFFDPSTGMMSGGMYQDLGIQSGW